jgi:hypothetical protein
MSCFEAEHLAIAAQGLVAAWCQPDQRPPPVPRIGLALQQAVALQVGHDLADHRLRPAHVRRGLADGQRTGQRQVLQHRSRCAVQLAPRPVTTMKRQVDGTESSANRSTRACSSDTATAFRPANSSSIPMRPAPGARATVQSAQTRCKTARDRRSEVGTVPGIVQAHNRSQRELVRLQAEAGDRAVGHRRHHRIVPE